MEKLKFKELLIHCCLLLTLLGCAGKSESLTDFDVKIAGLTALNQYSAGGAFLIGTQVDGTGSFLKRIDNDNSDTLSLELPNGTWDFHVIMWDGDHDADGSFADGTPAFTGIVRCGSSPSNLLDGSDLTVALTANNGNCADPIWGTPMEDDGYGRSINKFVQTNFFHCRKPLSEVTSSSDCMTDEARGLIHSARVLITPFKQFPGEGVQFENGNFLGSVCLKGSGGSDTLLSVVDPIDALSPDIHFPWGPAAGKGIPFNIQAFYKDNCDDSGRGLTNFIVPNGLKAGSGNIRLDETNREVAIFTPESLACAPPRGGLTTDFSVVLAGTLPEYGICNKEQFALIPAEFTTGREFYNKNFHLFSDINYFAGQNISPSNPPSVSNFPMIGDAFTGNEASSVAYSGTFDGNGMIITGMRIDIEGNAVAVSDIGFVRRLSGTVKNLTFILPEIMADEEEDHKRLGIAAGTVSGGTLEDISIIHGMVEGREEVGLFAGRIESSATLNFLDSIDSEVEGSRFVGGITGYASSSDITFTEFEGRVEIDSNENDEGFCEDPTEYWGGCTTNLSFEGFGGLVGKSVLSNISQSTSKGLLVGGTDNGGLIGFADAGTLNNSYSVMTVLGTKVLAGTADSTREGNTGGVVGVVGGGTGIAVDRVFHTIGTVANPKSDPTRVNSDFGFEAIGAGGGGATSAAALVPTSAEYDNFRNVGNYMVGQGFTSANGWRIDDSGYDIPILDWEAPRFCSGKFTGSFAGGSGTSDDPYLICSAQQFINMSTNFDQNFHYKLARPIDMVGASQTNGIFLPNSANAGKEFQGVFDGNGHFINNVGLIQLNVQAAPAGLFSVIGVNGVLKDFAVIGQFSSTVANARTVGLVAGKNKGLVERVKAFGLVDGTNIVNNSPNPVIGGVVGKNNGVMAGIESYVKVKGHLRVGGLAGWNRGGLILYSQAKGSVSPADANRLGRLIGGIVGENTPYNGVKSFTDNVNNEVFSYNGDIRQTSFSGELTTKYGPLATDRAVFYNAGLVAGRNEGVIKNVSLYGKLDLNLDGDPGYDSTLFDASVPDTIGANTIFTIGTGASTQPISGSIDQDWVAGDLIYRAGTANPIRIPTSDPSGSGYQPGIPTTTIISPFINVGFIAGYNSSSGSIENAFVHQNSEYSILEYFGDNFGYFVGYSESASPVRNSVFEGELNFNGANDFLANAGVDNNFFIHRTMTGNFLNEIVDTAQWDGSTLVATDTPTDLSSYGLDSNYRLGLGQYSFMPSGTVPGNDIPTTTVPYAPAATSFNLYIPDTTMTFDDTNFPDFYASTLGWDVGDWDMGNVWEEETGNSYSTWLVRTEQYLEYPEILEYIELVQGGAPSSTGNALSPNPTTVDITNGPETGGTSLVIDGNNLVGISSVFIGPYECSSLVEISDTSLNCTTGIGVAGTYDIIINNEYGETGVLPGAYTYNPPPSIASLSTTSGPAVGGTTITIYGSDFQSPPSSIDIGGVPCSSITFVSSTEVSCMTGSNSVGTYDVVLTNPDGQTSTLVNGFDYL